MGGQDNTGEETARSGQEASSPESSAQAVSFSPDSAGRNVKAEQGRTHLKSVPLVTSTRGHWEGRMPLKDRASHHCIIVPGFVCSPLCIHHSNVLLTPGLCWCSFTIAMFLGGSGGQRIEKVCSKVRVYARDEGETVPLLA